MKIDIEKFREKGGGGSYLIFWLLGVPFPILALIFLLRGCS